MPPVLGSIVPAAPAPPLMPASPLRSPVLPEAAAPLSEVLPAAVGALVASLLEVEVEVEVDGMLLLSDADLFGILSQPANANTLYNAIKYLVMVLLMGYSLKKQCNRKSSAQTER